MRTVVKQLDCLYDMLYPEFESRFSPKFRVGPFARRGAASDAHHETTSVGRVANEVDDGLVGTQSAAATSSGFSSTQ